MNIGEANAVQVVLNRHYVTHGDRVIDDDVPIAAARWLADRARAALKAGPSGDDIICERSHE